jgi:hypothetical protein
MSTLVLHANQAYWQLTAKNYHRIFPEGCRRQRLGILELNCGTGIDRQQELQCQWEKQ